MQLTKRVILITGRPGTGKTTVIMKTAEALKTKGITVGGMTTKEKREGDARVGFQILDLSTQRQGWLAHVNQPDGPRIGKYRVNMRDLAEIGANAITNAVKTSDTIVIDEIGPMELCSQTFKQAVFEAMDCKKPVVATIHYNATDPLVRQIKAREDAEIFEVTLENRNNLHNVIIEKVTKMLQEH
jgi:nucleoside-triphosphatase